MESARDAVLKKDAPADEAEGMIRSLTELRAIGPDFATLLVREAFVRQFRNRRALGGYVGLGGTPFSSGGSEREQGIGKDGNRRVRGRADQENRDRRPGSQAACRLVAVRD